MFFEPTKVILWEFVTAEKRLEAQTLNLRGYLYCRKSWDRKGHQVKPQEI